MLFLSNILCMKWLKDFLKSNKYAIIWTLCYFVCAWAILYFLFDFDMFARLDWWRLAHAHLRGFGAFVFVILLLAAVPLYVATTVVIVRTKKPLITLPVPQFLQHKTAAQPAAPDDAETVAPADVFPDDLPAELREPFLRARLHAGQVAVSGINNINLNMVNAQDVPLTPDESDLPLPPNFDDDSDEDSDDDLIETLSQMPVFSEVDFDKKS